MVTDEEAEAALPPGVARGSGPGGSPGELGPPSDAAGSGGQTGPQNEIRPFQMRPPADAEAADEGPISASPFTAVPTRAHGTGGAAASARGDEEE